MSATNSSGAKVSKKERFSRLPPEMQKRLLEFRNSIHGCRENTVEDYFERMTSFGQYLHDKGKYSYDTAVKQDIDLFLSTYLKPATKNVFIAVFRRFYNERPELISHLKIYDVELLEILPSEVLTPEEVVKLATEAGKRREIYKYVILTLFESCARISECLGLRVGDVQFQTVSRKDGQRSLIAVLYFRRSKGGVKKQPVTLVMFSGELQRWMQVHPCKDDKDAYLFPSPWLKGEPISREVVAEALWNAMQRTNLKKKCHPHWLRHSGLSFFANKGHSEILIGIRAGWVQGSSMSKRYVHIGHEAERRAYLEEMGLTEEDKGPEKQILPKPCLHCREVQGNHQI